MIGTVPKEIAVYKTKTFARFARKAHITDSELGRAALRIAGGETMLILEVLLLSSASLGLAKESLADTGQ